MNVHAPQSLQTRNELIQLASVPTQIITPKDSKPIISIVQDVALGVYRISKSFITITEKQMMNLMCPNPRFSGVLPPPSIVEGKVKLWSGRQALSSTLPSNVNFRGANNSYDDKNGEDKENYVIIESGEVKQGRLDTKVYQDRTRGLVHSIFNEYGPEETRHFFDNTQQLICNWLVLNGFSVGISDLVVDNETNESLKKIIRDMKVKVYDVLRDIHTKKFNNESILSDNDKFEEDVNKLLNDAIQQAGKVGLEKIDDVNNRMINMIKAGAKGNTVNISQMIACLGQQNIDGKRVAYGFESRTLPHYTKYDDGPEARGFVESSFIKGLTPQEFFFHSMGGREGLIDTAVKTSATGYIQRKLVKAMEDCKVSYDMTVRNANGNIIQFLYGEDGIDAIKIESQPLHYISMSVDKMESEYMISSKDDLSSVLTPASVEDLYKSHSNWQDRMLSHYKQLHEDREFFINRLFRGVQETSIMYPVSFTRIINNILVLRQKFGMAKILTDLSPVFVLDEIQRLCDEVRVSPNNKGTKLFEMLARMYLSPKQVIFRHSLDKSSFKQIIQQIKMRFYDSIVHPSEMVGVVAAQSIGEPLSQCTLNSVEWNTELLLDVNGQLQRVKIGSFVDKVLDTSNASNIEHHPNNTSLAWIKEKKVRILSCATNGQIEWKDVEAVTRHPVINKDGSNTLIKVTLHSGRQVTATKGHSFLKRVNNEIVGVDGDTLVVGDYLPISTILPTTDLPTMTKWDTSIYLPKTKFVYMSDNSQSRAWFKKNNGNTFTVPYTRSDGFVDAYRGIGHNKGQGRRCQKLQSLPGCVYPKNAIYQPAHIPEYLPLDAATGFFIGAYLAEGCCTPYHILISNTDDDFNQRIHDFCQKYAIKYHVDQRYINNGYSKTLRLHSVVLAHVLQQSIGTGAECKRFPPELLAAGDVFLANVIDGYFSGDGTRASKKQRSILATSVSKGLLEDIQQILTKFNVRSSIRADYTAWEINKKHTPTAKLSFTLSLGGEDVIKFKHAFKLTLPSKQARLDAIKTTPFFSKLDVIPNVITQEFGDLTIMRSEIDGYIAKCQNEQDRNVFERIQKETVFYDKIVDIEEVPNAYPYAYDLTISDTRTFNTFNGITQYDTFHLSGVGAASKATRGVPRIEELTRVTKNVKAPSVTIFFKPEYAQNKTICLMVKNKLETTTFKHIIKTSKIFFDPSDTETTISNDAQVVQMYRDFQIENKCDRATAPWLLRLELDKQKMLEVGLTTIELNHALKTQFNNRISCIFSDDNAEDIIFRIKLYEDVSEETTDMLTDLKALESTILDNIILKGVEKLQSVALEKEKKVLYNENTRAFEKTFEYKLYTEGTNLIQVLCMPYIDGTRTVSNDVNEIYKIFGIEAARQCLYNEIQAVITDAKVNVNYRHLALLVDTMTSKGTLMSIDRHGINKGDIGPLAKCSFEEVNDVLVKAGVFSEIDRVNGVSANIMLGQIAPCGTGDTDILIDESKLMPPLETTAPSTLSVNMNDEELEFAKEVVCQARNFEFNFALPEIDTSITRKRTVRVV